MSETHIAYVLRPFHRNQAKEIISAPKVYFFDTGFIHFFKGQSKFSENDKGLYFESLVLNELLSFVDRSEIHYWRDKSKNEIDFIIKKRGQPPIAIECKWKSSEFEGKALKKFREIHPEGLNVVVAADITQKRQKKLEICR